MSAPLPEGDVVYFPYAVVEIKLQSEPPPWVQGLLQTGACSSWGLHGSAGKEALKLCWSAPSASVLPLHAPAPAPARPAGMLLPVPKFSKFLHGAALLFQPRCANVPYWFLPGAQGRGWARQRKYWSRTWYSIGDVRAGGCCRRGLHPDTHPNVSAVVPQTSATLSA